MVFIIKDEVTILVKSDLRNTRKWHKNFRFLTFAPARAANYGLNVKGVFYAMAFKMS